MSKIFNNDREYKSKYYGKKKQPTEKQLNALKSWNELQHRVGRERALNIAEAKKTIKILPRFKNDGSGGKDAQETARRIFALTAVADRDELRSNEYLLYGLMESPEDVITAAEASDSGYLSYNEMMQIHAHQLQARLDALKARKDNDTKPTPF